MAPSGKFSLIPAFLSDKFGKLFATKRIFYWHSEFYNFSLDRYCNIYYIIHVKINTEI